MKEGSVRLVISDYLLSGADFNGLDLAAEVAKRGLPVIMVTACVDDVDLDAIENSDAVRTLIRKPFDIFDVRRRVEELIGPGGGAKQL